MYIQVQGYVNEDFACNKGDTSTSCLWRSKWCLPMSKQCKLLTSSTPCRYNLYSVHTPILINYNFIFAKPSFVHILGILQILYSKDLWKIINDIRDKIFK